MRSRTLFAALAATALALNAAAQASPFRTPGMPARSEREPPRPSTGDDASGQSSRFTTAFNPAFSFVVDVLADYRTADDTNDDGADVDLRALELSAQSWVDPHAWAYFVAATDGDSVGVEEAAVHYTGLGGNSTVRAGRFFVDFGKQMQVHPHDLRTVERPLVLRAYLGEEVKGDGLQWDDWTSVGESTVVRWSFGVFSSLLPEEEDDFDPTTTAEASVADRKRLEDLGFTARLTGFRDVGERGILQLGASARWIPSYELSFAPSGASETELSNAVYGLDATYGWTGDTGLDTWTFGAEYLFDSGDTGASIVDVGADGDPSNDALRVHDSTVQGWLAFADHAWSARDSAGVQVSTAELPDAASSRTTEHVAYYTRRISEFHRLRFEVARVESDADPDSTRFAVQYTAFVGAHGHGVNW